LLDSLLQETYYYRKTLQVKPFRKVSKQERSETKKII